MPNPGYQSEIHEVGDGVEAVTLRLAGRLSFTDAPALEREIHAVLAQPFNKVVLALGNVSEMDTAGAAVLVEGVLQGRRAGKRVLLCSPNASVMKLFELSGIAEVLEACCPTPATTWQRLQATA